MKIVENVVPIGTIIIVAILLFVSYMYFVFMDDQHISIRYGMFDKYNRDLTGNVCRQNLRI